MRQQTDQGMTQRQFLVFIGVAVGWAVLAWQARSLSMAVGTLFWLLLPFVLVAMDGWKTPGVDEKAAAAPEAALDDVPRAPTWQLVIGGILGAGLAFAVGWWYFIGRVR